MYMCLLTSLLSLMTGPLTQLFNPLLDMLAMTFDPDDHLVVHPCGHWVVKRLLGNESGGKSEEGGKGQEEGPSFAEMILDRVAADDIRAWTTTNRGAFVTCRYMYIHDSVSYNGMYRFLSFKVLAINCYWRSQL